MPNYIIIALAFNLFSLILLVFFISEELVITSYKLIQKRLY